MGKDPAFLFYPADASEDTQFMNRIERGCYFDILKAQKRFGKFTLNQIKKVLGSDFESCWESIEIVLEKEGNYYFIGWLKESIEKREAYTKSRRNNLKGKSHMDAHKVIHMEPHMVNINVNENGNRNVNKDKTDYETISEEKSILAESHFVPNRHPVFWRFTFGSYGFKNVGPGVRTLCCDVADDFIDGHWASPV